LSLGFIAFVTLLHIVGKVSYDLCISQRWTQLLILQEQKGSCT